jgi:LDH2 family malate/lactate/ureidoglycolate dehydrogenase
MKQVPRAEGFDDIFYPGEMEARQDIENRANGLVLPDDTLADLKKLADEMGLKEFLPF